VDLDGASRKSAEYLTINPFGRIQTLVDPGEHGSKPLIIRQSWAILIYLAERTGRLMPNEPRARATMWQWVAEAATDAAPSNATVAILRRQIPYVNAHIVEATPAR
jgi:glutathione S-transferase